MGTKTHEFYLAKNHSRNYEDTTAHMNCIIRNQCPNVQNNDSDCPNFTTRQERCPSTSRSIASSMTGYTLHSCRHGVLETWWMRCRWASCGDADIKQRPKAQKQVSQQKKNGQKGDYLKQSSSAGTGAVGMKAVISRREGGGEPGGAATAVDELGEDRRRFHLHLNRRRTTSRRNRASASALLHSPAVQRADAQEQQHPWYHG